MFSDTKYNRKFRRYIDAVFVYLAVQNFVILKPNQIGNIKKDSNSV